MQRVRSACIACVVVVHAAVLQAVVLQVPAPPQAPLSPMQMRPMQMRLMAPRPPVALAAPAAAAALPRPRKPVPVPAPAAEPPRSAAVQAVTAPVDPERFYAPQELSALPQPLAPPLLASPLETEAAGQGRVELLIDDRGRVLRVLRRAGLEEEAAWQAVQHALLGIAFSPARRGAEPVKAALLVDLAVQGRQLHW